MAEVYRAVAPGAEGFKRDLVVKKILTAQAQAANFIEMFVHEARISALLHHPNVVQVFDFGHVDGSYFLVMELLRGRDLLAVLRSLRERQRLLPVPVVAHIAHQVALGLGYAHALTSPTGEPLNIVHRDVSPSNVMCLRAGGVKLLDFGVARAIGEVESSETGETGAFTFKGKLGYMAPERLLGRPEDHRVDLFALGVVLWEMCTGRRLFQGKTDQDKIRAILEKTVPAPSSLRPEIPPALDAVVAKALERDPERRYASGREMADDLETIVSETKYHSRMLPALLTELFGSSPSAAHAAMAMLPPELLSVDPTPSSTPSTTTSASTPSSRSLAEESTAPGTAGDLRRRVLLIAGVTVGAAVLGAGIALWSSGSRRAALPPGAASAQRTPPPALVAPAPPTATATTTAMAPVVDRAPAVEPPSGPAADSAAESTTGPAQSSGVRRSVVAKTRATAGGRISRGLSIDPFAEAASRGLKK
jgi:serine/threonine protein kinase